MSAAVTIEHVRLRVTRLDLVLHDVRQCRGEGFTRASLLARRAGTPTLALHFHLLSGIISTRPVISTLPHRHADLAAGASRQSVSSVPHAWTRCKTPG